MKEIPLTRGLVAQIDDDDFDRLSQWNWCAQPTTKNGSKGPFYAASRKGRDGPLVLMHREVMQAKPGQFVDHIDGNRLKNCKSNLRFCTIQQNAANTKTRKGRDHKGVTLSRQTRLWVAEITVDYRGVFIGQFIDKADAAHAYDVAAIHYFGEFARLNFTREESLAWWKSHPEVLGTKDQKHAARLARLANRLSECPKCKKKFKGSGLHTHMSWCGVPPPSREKTPTGFRGVYRDRRRFADAFFAIITINGKRKYLGTFRSIEEALAARNAAQLTQKI